MTEVHCLRVKMWTPWYIHYSSVFTQMWQVIQQTVWQTHSALELGITTDHTGVWMSGRDDQERLRQERGKGSGQRMPRWGGASLHFNRKSRSQRLKHGAQPLVRFYFCQTKRNKRSMEISMSKSRRGDAVSLRGSLEMLNCRKPREYNIDWEWGNHKHHCLKWKGFRSWPRKQAS